MLARRDAGVQALHVIAQGGIIAVPGERPRTIAKVPDVSVRNKRVSGAASVEELAGTAGPDVLENVPSPDRIGSPVSHGPRAILDFNLDIHREDRELRIHHGGCGIDPCPGRDQGVVVGPVQIDDVRSAECA